MAKSRAATIVVVGLSLIALIQCSEQQKCDDHELDEARKLTPKTKQELLKEIDVLLSDKSCYGIQPEDLRKILKDAIQLPQPSPYVAPLNN